MAGDWRLLPALFLDSLQVLNLGLEHIDEQSEAMGQRMDRVGALDVLPIVVNQGETG